MTQKRTPKTRLMIATRFLKKEKILLEILNAYQLFFLFVSIEFKTKIRLWIGSLSPCTSDKGRRTREEQEREMEREERRLGGKEERRVEDGVVEK